MGSTHLSNTQERCYGLILNKRIKRKPYLIPRIQDLLLKLEGFQYATTLDLNMGYYHIKLSPFSKCCVL
jgi:hypothetical protein